MGVLKVDVAKIRADASDYTNRASTISGLANDTKNLITTMVGVGLTGTDGKSLDADITSVATPLVGVADTLTSIATQMTAIAQAFEDLEASGTH